MLILLMSTYVYLSTKLKKSKQPYHNADNVYNIFDVQCVLTFEHILVVLVDVHLVVLANVDLVDGPINLAMMLTKVLMCHVYF